MEIKELKNYLRDRIVYFLEDMELKQNEFDIEASAYAIARISEHIYHKMRELNAQEVSHDAAQ